MLGHSWQRATVPFGDICMGPQIEEHDPNPFAEEGFKLPSGTHKCCCVAVRIGDSVDVRDTKDAKSSTLSFTKDEWQTFVAGVKNGEFDV